MAHGACGMSVESNKRNSYSKKDILKKYMWCNSRMTAPYPRQGTCLREHPLLNLHQTKTGAWMALVECGTFVPGGPPWCLTDMRKLFLRLISRRTGEIVYPSNFRNLSATQVSDCDGFRRRHNSDMGHAILESALHHPCAQVHSLRCAILSTRSIRVSRA
jgi:hypothetical protein